MIFYKTSSFGNDFIAIDIADLPPGAGGRPGRKAARAVRPPSPCGTGVPLRDKAALARRICDRQRGVGADGVVFYRLQGRRRRASKAAVPLWDRPGRKAGVPLWDCRFEIFNRDGGAAELSGNGMAGLAAVLFQRRLARSPLALQAAIGRRRVELLERRGRCFRLNVEIGVPDFADHGFFPFLSGGRDVYRVDDVEFHPVSVGNPHAVVICRESLEGTQLAALGEMIESHAMFPKRVNVEFVEPGGEGKCRIFFYERGVGPTRASSTGSAAVFAVLRRLGLVKDRLEVECAAPEGCGSEPIHVGWRDGITVRTVTHLVCRGEYFL
jgi:diaminopimelate epimerase